MPAEDVNSWSATAANNATADAAINFAEGQSPGSLNDSARSMMAAVAKWLADNNGTRSTAGTSGVYTYASASELASALFTGCRLCIKAHTSNASGATLNVTPNGGSAWGAKAIRVFGSNGDTGVEANQIKTGGIYFFVYDATANGSVGGWILQNPSFDKDIGTTTFTNNVTFNTDNFVRSGMPAFSAFNSVTDTDVTGDGTAATVDFDTEVFDRGADFALDTFTAPITGLYQLCGGVILTGLIVGTHTVVIEVITSNRTYQVVTTSPASATQSFQWSTLADLDISDTAFVRVTVSGGAKTVDVFGSASLLTYFTGYLVG